MSRPKIGDRFGRLTVIGPFSHIMSSGTPRPTVWCRCDCGIEKYIYIQYLRKAKSCGCAKIEAARAQRMAPGEKVIDSPVYSTWRSMRQRCTDPNCVSFKFYGARGIVVCAEWQDDFRVFEAWAYATGYRPGLSIDRIDNDQGYSPINCRWATPKEQARNTRRNRLVTAFGETKSVTEWTEDFRCCVSVGTLWLRIERGIEPEIAITAPPVRGRPASGGNLRSNLSEFPLVPA